MATPADIRAVRFWVGSEPDDEHIENLVDEPLTVAATALAILGPRLADLAATSSSGSVTLTVPDDFTRTTQSSVTANLSVLRAQVAQLQALVEAESGVDTDPMPVASIGHLARCDTR